MSFNVSKYRKKKECTCLDKIKSHYRLHQHKFKKREKENSLNLYFLIFFGITLYDKFLQLYLMLDIKQDLILEKLNYYASIECLK